MVDLVPDYSVELAHDLLVHFEVQLAIIDRDQQLGVATCGRPLDAGFDLEVQTLDVLANVDELAELAVELSLTKDVVLRPAFADDAFADFQDRLLDDSLRLLHQLCLALALRFSNQQTNLRHHQ